MTAPNTEPIMQEELCRIARAARTEAGITQDEAARRLGVSIPSVSKAENDPSGRYLNLQRRMIEDLAGWQLRGPLCEVTKEADKN